MVAGFIIWLVKPNIKTNITSWLKQTLLDPQGSRSYHRLNQRRISSRKKDKNRMEVLLQKRYRMKKVLLGLEKINMSQPQNDGHLEQKFT